MSSKIKTFYKNNKPIKVKYTYNNMNDIEKILENIILSYLKRKKKLD